jgi:hypothetical protein
MANQVLSVSSGGNRSRPASRERNSSLRIAKSVSREKGFLRRVKGPILEILFPYLLLNAYGEHTRYSERAFCISKKKRLQERQTCFAGSHPFPIQKKPPFGGCFGRSGWMAIRTSLKDSPLRKVSFGIAMRTCSPAGSQLSFGYRQNDLTKHFPPQNPRSEVSRRMAIQTGINGSVKSGFNIPERGFYFKKLLDIPERV